MNQDAPYTRGAIGVPRWIAAVSVWPVPWSRHRRATALTALVWRRTDSWGAAAVSAALALVLHDAVTPKTTLLMVAIAVLYWFGYAINDYFDAPFDAQQPHKANANFFVMYRVPRGVLAAVTAVVMALLVAVFALFAVRGLALLALGSAVMWSYSAPPARLKSRPGLDLLAHALFVLTFPYLLALLLAGAAWSTLDWVLLALSCLSSLGGQFSQQVRDFDIDSRTDLNFTTTFGLGLSIVCLRVTTAATILLFLAAVAARIMPGAVIPLGILCLPVQIERLLAQPGRYESAPFHNLLATAALAYSSVWVGGMLLK